MDRAKGSSIRIPRHAPSYHIDLAIVTILSSPAMLACTIAAGRRGKLPTRERRKGIVPHGIPCHPTMRGCGPLEEGGRVSENDDERERERVKRERLRWPDRERRRE